MLVSQTRIIIDYILFRNCQNLHHIFMVDLKHIFFLKFEKVLEFRTVINNQIL